MRQKCDGEAFFYAPVLDDGVREESSVFSGLCALNPKAQALFLYSRSNSAVRRQDRANCDKMEGF